jgi:ATP-binding cassette subfamily F protein uup
VTQVIASEGDGLWREYIGGYSDWEKYRPSSAAPARSTGKADVKSETKDAGSKKKLSYKEQRELENLPVMIAELEAEQASISRQLADPKFYQQQASEVERLNKRFAEIDAQLLLHLEKWEGIEARS